MSYPVFYVPSGDVLPILFDSFDGGTGASITMTGLATSDIKIHKDGSPTARSSTAGFTLLDTDGIDFNSTTGIHGFSIDTGDNTDAGFYSVGAWFHVVVSSITVDAQTVNFVAAAFRLMAAEGVAGVPDVNVTHVGDTVQTANDNGADINAILVDTNELQTDWVNGGRLDLILDIVAADTTTDIPALIAALPTAAENADAIWDEDATGHQTGGTFGQAIGDPGASTETLFKAIITDPAGTNIAADVIAIKAETASILTDTAEIGAAGAGLTNINLPNQTMDITGNITGNLSGSVGSVTGAVGSVTGAVGSVTGNVGGNVAGSVGSVTATTAADVVSISGDTTAADRLEALMDGIIVAQVNDAAATTTVFIADGFTEATNDHFNGRLITFLTGALAGQQTDITDYVGATQTLTVTALTEAPAENDFFVIH